MAKRKQPTPPPAKPTPAPPPPVKRGKGRPRITPPGAGPARRLVVSDLGPYAGRCLAEIKAAMAASEGGVVTDADVVRFALWLAAGMVAKEPGRNPEDFMGPWLAKYRHDARGGPGR